MKEETMSYAEKAGRGVKEVLQQMNVRRVDVSRKKVKRFEDLADVDDEDDGNVVLHLPKALKEFIEESILVFWSFVTETQKVEIGEKEKVEECFTHIKVNLKVYSKRTEIWGNRGECAKRQLYT